MAIFDAAALASCFGIAAEQLPRSCRSLLAAHDFSYKVLEGSERDTLILEILRRIDGDSQKIGAAERKNVWEAGWRESLNAFVASNFDAAKLVPKFIRPQQVVRLNRQFVEPADPQFELHFVELLREWMFREFFADVGAIHEFGCGTGFNLLALAKIFPKKRLYGSDFVPASVELVKQIAATSGLAIEARLFDMTEPASDYSLGRGDGIFTFGSLEQLAGQFERFLDFLLERRPAICVHVEPTIEFYQESNLVDYLAMRFQRKRGYTEGFLPRLRALAAGGQIELLRSNRLNFGSLMMEGYNLMVWRPVV